MMNKVLVAARIPGETHRLLSEVCRREDRTTAYVVRKAVEEYLQGQAKQARKSSAVSGR